MIKLDLLQLMTLEDVDVKKGIIPIVRKQIVKEYNYAYSTFSPKDGTSDFLILPNMYA